MAVVANWKDLYTRIICRNYEEIDATMYIHSWKKNRLAYVKYHNTLRKKVPNVIEQGALDSFYTEYPHYIKEILQNLSATCYLFGNQERTL